MITPSIYDMDMITRLNIYISQNYDMEIITNFKEVDRNGVKYNMDIITRFNELILWRLSYFSKTCHGYDHPFQRIGSARLSCF